MKLTTIRGMHDVLPEQSAFWQFFEKNIVNIIQQYGYQEIRMPIVEKTELFKRSIGEITDIVEKEMYTFEDRNGDSLTLRPEGTASCVRAGIEHGLLHNKVQRLWYMGPMFRHERPQKGRYRQFHQIGVETFGIASADIDAELIMMTARFWKVLGLDQYVELEINSLGSSDCRKAYRQTLIDYFEQHLDVLDEEAKHRLHLNPLRILDSKNPAMQDIITRAPKLIDVLDEASKIHFEKLLSILDAAGIAYKINPRLVRGLDYYSKTVFEWVTSKLGAQGTVCAGGRYDGLVKQLGGRETPAAGFAMGIERLLALLEEVNPIEPIPQADIYMVVMGEAQQAWAMQLAEQLREHLPQSRLLVNCGGGSAKSQFKKANQSKASLALIVGEQEMQNNQVGVKFLFEQKPQETVSVDQLVAFLQKNTKEN